MILFFHQCHQNHCYQNLSLYICCVLSFRWLCGLICYESPIFDFLIQLELNFKGAFRFGSSGFECFILVKLLVRENSHSNNFHTYHECAFYFGCQILLYQLSCFTFVSLIWSIARLTLSLVMVSYSIFLLLSNFGYFVCCPWAQLCQRSRFYHYSKIFYYLCF